MAEVIITGGQGFLGGHLTKRLASLGMDVCSTYSYTPPIVPPSHNLSFFKLDVTQFADCLKMVNQESPKVIYHLVAQPLVTSALRHPFPTFELTIRGVYNLLDAVRQSGKDTKVVIFTSDKVYGENTNAREEDRLDTVSHPYEVAKVCEDMIARSYADMFGMSVVTVRSANVYGERDLHWDRLVPHICKSLVHDTAPVFRSRGTHLRDYLYVSDVVDGILLASKLGKGAVNLGAVSGITALGVLDILLYVSGKQHLFPTQFADSVGEISSQHINWDFAKSLGWYPKTSLDDGMEKTYTWYREYFQ